MTTQELKLVIDETLERNLKILLDAPDAPTMVGPFGREYIAVNYVRALHQSVAANLAQALMGICVK